jgi:hypothetical protein
MEIIPGLDLNIGINLIVGIMVKVLMVFLVILSLIMVRQESLMDKVVNIPLGRNLKMVVWTFFILTLMLAAIVIVLA